MGGHVGGATASKIAIDSILDFFEKPVQNVYVGINDALRFANTQVYNAALENPELKGMGTTATILLINSTDCYIGHVGDSRIYLKSEGVLNRITKDHSFVQQLVDQGLIADEDAENHPKKNQILQAIGIKPDVEPTVCEAPIHPQKGDCFLLCSDGLNGMISDDEIKGLVDESNISESCQKLITAANNAGGKDNVTATLVAITESPYATSKFKEFNPAVGASTIIESREDEVDEPKSKRLLYIILGAALLLISALCIWFFVLSNNSEKEDEKLDKKPKTEKKKNAPEESDSKKDDSGETPTGNSNEVEVNGAGNNPEPVPVEPNIVEPVDEEPPAPESIPIPTEEPEAEPEEKEDDGNGLNCS